MAIRQRDGWGGLQLRHRTAVSVAGGRATWTV